MKYLIVTALVLLVDVSRSKITNDFTKNIVPMNTTINNNAKLANDFTIPIMIHVDEALTHSLPIHMTPKIKDIFRLKAYEILQDVEKFFSYPSLMLKIKMELLDLKVLNNRTQSFAASENVSQYLKSFCTWQGEKKKHKWYYSVLFTGLDLFYLNNHGMKVWSSTGRGYMKGMCSMRNSCTLLEWRPEYMAYVLAHEIAHSLGITHDGYPYNNCHGQRFIMDAKLNPHNQSKIWSPCSRIDLDQYLKSDYAWCLRQDNLTVTDYA